MNYWIFQSGKQHYDLETHLVAGRQANWMVRQGRRGLKAGDVVFFWQVNDLSPLRGWGVLTGSPFPDGNDQKIAVMYEEAFPRPPRIDEITAIEELRNLPVLVTMQGTNFLLTRRQARALNRLVENRVPYSKWEPILLDVLIVLEIVLAIATIGLAIRWYLKELSGLEPLTIICGALAGLLEIIRQKLTA